MVFDWPSQVPVGLRQPTDFGRTCFGLQRGGATFWDRQTVRLTGNLLIVVTTGTVVVERPWQRQAVNTGGACWLLPGDYKLSEVPDVAGRFKSDLVFFDDRAIGRSIGSEEKLESFCRIPSQSMYSIYPQPQLGSVLLNAASACGILFPNELRKSLVFAANSGGSAMFMFLGHGYYARKTALNLWLEYHVISKKSANELAGLYPAGRRRFFSDFATYQALNPAQWLRKRRMELAATWIKHGTAPIELIAKAAGYDDEQRFRRDYIYERGHDPRREERLQDAHILSGKTLQDCIMPFWYVAPFSLWEELRRIHDNSDMEIPKFTAAQRRRALRLLNIDGRKKTEGPRPMPAAPPVQEAEVDFRPYWEMKSTCAANIIEVPRAAFTGATERTIGSMAA